MKEKKLPYIHFYPGDWLKDVAVQSLDFEQKGIWFEMLLLMFESEPRGYLTLNGEPMETEILAKFLKKTSKKTSKVVEILLSRGVAKMDKNGCIFNARMVRDVDKRLKYKENGSKGGLAKKENNPSKILANDLASDKQSSSPIVIVICIDNKKEHSAEKSAPLETKNPPKKNLSPEEKESHAVAVDCVEFFRREYKKHQGTDFDISGTHKSGGYGRAIEIFKRLLKRHSLDHIRLMLIKYVQDNDVKIVQAAHPLGWFELGLQKYSRAVKESERKRENDFFV